MTMTHDTSAMAATTTPLSRLDVLEGDAVNPRMQRQMKNLESVLGYVPHWLQTWTIGHGHAARFVDYLLPLLDAAGENTLPFADRELLAAVTSTANGCSYCRLNHIPTLSSALGDRGVATRVTLDYRDVDELTPRQRALADFAVALAEDAHQVDAATFDRLRGHGLSDEQIFEAMMVITVFCAANRLMISMNVRPDDQFFE
jgi:uncharacterized peroxidase-related enzyme